MKKKKERLDILLTSRNLVESRNRAQGLILGGKVFVDGQRVDKCGAQICEDAEITLAARKEWVSRGAHKLLRAFEVFPFSVEGLCGVDIGASTGGFTEVLLSRGARKIYAVDVGYGQFHWKLRQDSRVVVMERTNARYLEKEAFDDPPEFCVMDASFISCTCILPAMERILPPGGEAVLLIKPQFEAGRERLGKNGVVSDPLVHREVLSEVLSHVQDRTAFGVKGLDVSPIKGPKGNVEFLLYLEKKDTSLPEKIYLQRIDELMIEVHGEIHD